MTASSANLILAKKLNRLALIATGAVIILVIIMREVDIPVPDGVDFGFLPPLYSLMNVLTAIALVMALVFVKQKKISLHKKTMLIALACSVLFLLGYVLYHFTSPPTLFGDADHNGVLSELEQAAVAGIRPIYLLLLLTHIILAALSLPFILFTFIRGYTNQIERHRKMAKWVFPIWLYVAITGPVCYLMLMPYYS